jgi:uncharacterized protein YcsI (UPF0317 family)
VAPAFVPGYRFAHPGYDVCGVTPQAVIAAAKLPFAITHAPGLMLVTDLRNKALAVL